MKPEERLGTIVDRLVLGDHSHVIITVVEGAKSLYHQSTFKDSEAVVIIWDWGNCEGYEDVYRPEVFGPTPDGLLDFPEEKPKRATSLYEPTKENAMHLLDKVVTASPGEVCYAPNGMEYRNIPSDLIEMVRTFLHPPTSETEAIHKIMTGCPKCAHDKVYLTEVQHYNGKIRMGIGANHKSYGVVEYRDKPFDPEWDRLTCAGCGFEYFDDKKLVPFDIEIKPEP